MRNSWRLAGRLADLVELEPPVELRPRIDRALEAVTSPGRHHESSQVKADPGSDLPTIEDPP